MLQYEMADESFDSPLKGHETMTVAGNPISGGQITIAEEAAQAPPTKRQLLDLLDFHVGQANLFKQMLRKPVVETLAPPAQNATQVLNIPVMSDPATYVENDLSLGLIPNQAESVNAATNLGTPRSLHSNLIQPSPMRQKDDLSLADVQAILHSDQSSELTSDEPVPRKRETKAARKKNGTLDVGIRVKRGRKREQWDRYVKNALDKISLYRKKLKTAI